MTDSIVKCKKCKKNIFYIPEDYSMNIKIECINCHDRIKVKKGRPSAASNFSKVKRGKRPDIHPTYFFRSPNEMNFARILNYLNLEWKFEERVFTFPNRRVRPFIYVMDFEVIKGNDQFPKGYFEVKGWMKPADRQKLRLLKLHYPEEFKVTQIILSSKYKKKDIAFCKQQGYTCQFYDELTKEYSKQISMWDK